MSDDNDAGGYDLAPEPINPPPKPPRPVPPPPAAAARRETPVTAVVPQARPAMSGENGLTLQEQAGRISWLAPGLLCLLTVLVPARNLDRSTAGVLLAFEGVIWLAGLAACGYAWVGWLRNREDGLPRGAVAGLLLNLLLLVGLVAFGIFVAGGGLNQPLL